MAEDQSFNLMPYFVWTIKDVFSTVNVKSPIFTVADVKFSMIFHQQDGISTICMAPEVENEQSKVASYAIRASISTMDLNNSFKEFIFIQKTTNRNQTGLKESHLVWKVESKILDSLEVVQEENGKKNVTFLCVFGSLCEHQNDMAALNGPWREFHCMERLGKDLNDLRLKDSSTQLKCGNLIQNVHEVILSARSKPLLKKVRDEKVVGKEVEIENMEMEVFENFITYIYSGRLKDSRPSTVLLKQLYEAAHKYEVESLKSMTSLRLVEFLYKEKLSSSQEEDKEKLSSSQEEDKEKLSSSQEEDKEKLSSSQEEDKDDLSSSHEKDKDDLSSSLEKDKERVYNLSIDLLVMAGEYNDKFFKESVRLSIIHNNDFILRDEKWKKMFQKNSKLAFEVYDNVVTEIKT